MNELRIGVLGVGRIGKMHAELIERQTPGATVSRVFDVFSDGAKAVGDDVGAKVSASAQELIEADDVDAVAICSSTDTHIDLLVAAAQAGKPVFIEKPLSLDLTEVNRGVAAVEASGIAVQVGFNRRFDASHRAVRDAVANGDIGEIQMLRITSRDPAPPPIAYIEVSGGIFCDMTIHDFDMARYVTGSEVVDVYARGSVMIDPAIGEAGDIDTAVVVMTHANGCITTIDNSRQAVYGYDQRVEAFGSGGLASSDNPTVNTTTIRSASGSQGATIPYFFIERYIPSYLAQWGEFVKMVRDGAPSPVSIADGKAPLVMGMAAWRSLREQRTVDISEIS